jgi:hypothetical protein
MLALLLPIVAQAQAVYQFGTFDLFGVTTVTLVDTMADTSAVRSFNGSRSGDLRISAMFDTTSGTTGTVYISVGIRISQEFGASATTVDAYNFKFTTIDSFVVADDHTTKTWEIIPDFDFADAPITGYVIRTWQTSGVQTNRLKFTVLEYKPL